jgi:hypothetical protein
VEEWQNSLRQSEVSDSDESLDSDEQMVEYLAARPTLLQEFDGIAAKLGIPAQVRRWLLTKTRSKTIKTREVLARIRLFLGLLQGWEFRDGKRILSSDGGFEITLHLGFPGESDNLAADAEAMRLFLLLLQSSIQLGKCSLVGCQRYFLNIGGCRRFCCKGHTQSLVNQKVLQRLKIERDLQKNGKLDRVRRAIRKYELAQPNQDWKVWVAKEAKVSKNFLTFHVGQGGLREPRPHLGQ